MQHKGGLSRRSSFLLLTLIVTVSAIGATAYTLWRLRVEAINRHFDAAAMYAHALENHLTQSFNVIDLTMTNALATSRADTPAGAALAAALRHAPYLRSLALLDGNGVIAASSDMSNLGVRIARTDFLPPATEPRAVLRVGPPWVGRDFHDGRAATPQRPAAPERQGLIPVLRDIAVGPGDWATVLASINTDYFLNYYAHSLTADAGVIELLRYDGVLLLSSDRGRTPGVLSYSDKLASRIGAQEFGRFEERLADGRDVLTAYRGSPAHPLLVVVHLDKDRGLAGWRREAGRTTTVVATVLLAALALASVYFVRMERATRQHDVDGQQLRLRGAALEAVANSIIITDRGGAIEWANPAFCALSGYTMEETIGRNPRELIKSGAQAAEGYRALWRTILAGEVWRGELINRRKDESTYLEDQTITPLRDDDGVVRHFIAVKEDITERKRGEKRMEELSRHLVVVQESARRRLSGELHDRTSPNLAAIGVNLDVITATMLKEPSPLLSERIEDVRALIEDTTASIREICSDLRPPVLDYAGLAAALESYIKQFQRRTGVAVRFDCALPAARLAPELESVLFRTVQEALTNCAKHARARAIVVSLCFDSPRVSLIVSDDGTGFDPAALGKTTHTGGLGIITMREMAEFSGGGFRLESAPGNGTRITVDLPATREAAPPAGPSQGRRSQHAELRSSEPPSPPALGRGLGGG
ncbi:MAG: PAS domain-containing protein [Sulfuritalea sp.]|nr:PAS domain-containing protein [Sulfuritalea sp.]